MIIRLTTDKEEIKTVLCDRDIFYVISGGKVKIDEYEPPLSGCLYLAGYVNSEIIGVSCFHKFRDGLKFHPNVLKRFRARYGRDFVQKTANMLKCCIYAEIPKSRKGLTNLSKKMGFNQISESLDKTIVRLER